MLTDFHMTYEQFQDLPKLEQTDVKIGTLFIFRMFYEFGLCVIEEMDDKEISFRVIAKTKRYSLNIDSSQKLLIPVLLEPAKMAGANMPFGEMRLYVKS